MFNYRFPIRFLASFFLIMLIISNPIKICAQKVGVVLSGGGSRGVAHIGVLKALEENQIPIDYIVGTSMGAVVGGLYAAGYTPDQIASVVSSDNFKRWASGEENPDFFMYFRSPDQTPSWFSLNFKFGKNLLEGLPTNIVSPHELDFELMELFSGIHNGQTSSFDSLMVPFRCVAADIDSTRLEVFRKGNLAHAVRASLTYPFFFKPIKINNKVYFDGGMYNNFPVDVLIEEFNPDFIIGSKVVGNYPSPDPDNIVSQVQTLLMAKTDYSVPADKGILIAPQVERVGVLDFSLTEAFIDSGYVAAQRKMDIIKQKVHRLLSIQDVNLKRNAFVSDKKPVIIDTIYFKGFDQYESHYAYRLMTRRKHYISSGELKSDYFRLIADETISYIQPTLQFNDSTGYFDLYLDIRKNDPFTASFGGNISSRYANQAFIEITNRYLFSKSLKSTLNMSFGRFYSSGLLGGRLDFPSRIPLAFHLTGVYNHWDYFKNSTHFFDDQTPSYLIKREISGFFDVSVPLSRVGKITGGISSSAFRYTYHQNNDFSKTDTADRTSLDVGTLHLTFDLNNLNKKQYSNAGSRFLIQMKHVEGTEQFDAGQSINQYKNYSRERGWNQVRMVWDNYFKRMGPVVFGFYLDVFLSDQVLFKNYTSSLLSAPVFSPIPETQTLFLPKYRAYSYAGSGLKVILKMGKRFDWRFEGYVFQPYKEIYKANDNSAYFGKAFSDRIYLASSSIIFHGIFGPVSLGLNYFEKEDVNIQATLNIGFILFNRSAMD